MELDIIKKADPIVAEYIEKELKAYGLNMEISTMVVPPKVWSTDSSPV